MQANDNAVFLSLLVSTIAILGILGYFFYEYVKAHRVYLHQLLLRDESKLVALEEERKLIAMDLHDDLGPILTAAHFRISSIGIHSKEDKDLQEKAIEYTRMVVKRLKHWSNELVPQRVMDGHPFEKLQEFIQSIADKYPLTINYYPFDQPELPANLSLHLYRMLKEIVHNAIKHSSATNLAIYGKTEGHTMTVMTVDDGIGFLVKDAEQHTGGIGLQGLRTRARLINAKLLIRSAPGDGTFHKIEIQLP